MARRVAIAGVTLAGITALTFVALRLLPGDPFATDELSARSSSSPEVRERMRAALHLDEPVPAQYLKWVGGLLRGDFGPSLYDGEPVGSKILSRLPATLALTSTALALSWALGLSIALLSARRPRGSLDRAGGIGIFALAATPVFWLGLILQMTLAVRWRLFPLQGIRSDGSAGWPIISRWADLVWHLALPAGCLALTQSAFIARIARTALLAALDHPFARAARARGASESAILSRHAWPVAAVSLAQVAGMSLPGLVAGAFIVERVFSWPGLGSLLFDSISRRDTTTVMGLATLTSALTLAGTLLADMLAAAADPRLRPPRSVPLAGPAEGPGP